MQNFVVVVIIISYRSLQTCVKKLLLFANSPQWLSEGSHFFHQQLSTSCRTESHLACRSGSFNSCWFGPQSNCCNRQKCRSAHQPSSLSAAQLWKLFFLTEAKNILRIQIPLCISSVMCALKHAPGRIRPGGSMPATGGLVRLDQKRTLHHVTLRRRGPLTV